MSELGCAKNVRMEVRLQEEKPFTFEPYRMDPSEAGNINKMIKVLMNANIIQKSNSNYALLIVLVHKKSGGKNLCVDYCKLNSVTLKDSHPLPRISDQIDRLHTDNITYKYRLRKNNGITGPATVVSLESLSYTRDDVSNTPETAQIKKNVTLKFCIYLVF